MAAENIKKTLDTSLDIANDLGKKYLNNNISRQILIVLVILILIFGLISFLFYNTIGKVKVLLNETVGLFNDMEMILPSENINQDKTLKETYILYLNIDNHSGNGLYFDSFGNNKPILWRKDGESITDSKFAIEYNPKKNCLMIRFAIGELNLVTSEDYFDEVLNLTNKNEYVSVCDIPYQKWFQLVVSINNRNVDVYINRYLRKTQFLNNVPKLSNEPLVLGTKGKNPNLFIGRVEYVGDVINNNEIAALYLKNMKFLKIERGLRNKINYEGYLKIHNNSPSI